MKHNFFITPRVQPGKNEMRIARYLSAHYVLSSLRFRIRQNFLALISCIFIYVLALFLRWTKILNFYDNNAYGNVEICYRKASDDKIECRLDCSKMKNHFSLPGMNSCHPFLTCEDSISKGDLIAQGYVKVVYKAKWNGHTVALNTLRRERYDDDFNLNVKRLKQLNPSKYITQLIGECNGSFVTEFHGKGRGDGIHKVIDRSHEKYRDAKTKFRLCTNYVEILDYLHSSPVGVLMLCDSNSIWKSMTQMLVTDDLRLVMNDLDCVMEVKKGVGVVCNENGHIDGTLLAPEQLWPYSKKLKYNLKLMKRYDEKVDIWRVPDVCEFLLRGNGTESIKITLASIHNRCKNEDPTKRPNTREVLVAYRKAKDLLGL